MKEILDRLKKQPLIGLALAIAAGYLLAHIAIGGADYIYEKYYGEDVGSVFTFLAIICVPALLMYKFRGPLLRFLAAHKWKLAIATIVVIASWSYAAIHLQQAEEGRIYLQQFDGSKKVIPPGHNPYDDLVDGDIAKQRQAHK